MNVMQALFNAQMAPRNLQDSLYYRQASPFRQRQMEQMVERGLPATTDPQRVFNTGVARPEAPMLGNYYGVRRESGFGGGWGSIGRPQESTGKLKAGAPLGSAGSSGYALAEKMKSERNAATRPTAEAAESRVGYDEQLARDVSPISSQLGFGGTSALPFTGFGRMVREDMMGGGSPYSSYWNQTLAPRFPFSDY